MLRYDVFRALNPTEDYPVSLFSVVIRGVPYDLALPPEVCDLIFESNCGSKYERIDQLCSPNGFARLRENPALLDHPDDLPAFAGCEVREDTTGPDTVTGYTLHLLAFNEEVVRSLFMRPVERGSLADKASHWVKEHFYHLLYSGGFEVARYLCYTSSAEKKEVETFVSRVAYGGEADDLLERHVRKVRFRDVAKSRVTL